MNKNIIITSEFPPFPGGIGNHAYCLASELYKNAKNVKVITDFRSVNHVIELDFDSKLPYEVKRVTNYKIRFFIYFLRTFYALREVFSTSKKNFILSGKFSIWIGGLMTIFHLKHKYIAVVHGSEVNAGGQFAKKYTAWCLSRFTNVIAVSNFTKELILERVSIPVTVINNGFSPLSEQETIKEKKLNLDALNIITVGNVTYRKGQNNVIAVLPQIKKLFPNVHYHMIGIPTEQNKFEELANKLNVKEHITFYGAISNNALSRLMTQSDVFFMLSNVLDNGDVEGFGIAVIEANAYGIPAIGSINSGIADAIKNDYSGKLVNPENQEEIMESLTDILNNYKDYSIHAMKWSKQFTWGIVVKKYLEIID